MPRSIHAARHRVEQSLDGRRQWNIDMDHGQPFAKMVLRQQLWRRHIKRRDDGYVP